MDVTGDIGPEAKITITDGSLTVGGHIASEVKIKLRQNQSAIDGEKKKLTVEGNVYDYTTIKHDKDTVLEIKGNVAKSAKIQKYSAHATATHFFATANRTCNIVSEGDIHLGNTYINVNVWQTSGPATATERVVRNTSSSTGHSVAHAHNGISQALQSYIDSFTNAEPYAEAYNAEKIYSK